jgi:DNA invertase Pin-like site-specific DNA recombinase
MERAAKTKHSRGIQSETARMKTIDKKNNNGEVVSLVRVSTQEQAGEYRAGIARQQSANRETAARYGLKIRFEIVAIDISGRHTRHHPEFQRLFAALKDPAIAGVVCAEQSRIFRPENYGDVAILDEFALNKKMIYTPGEVIDAATPTGFMNLMVNAAMSGQELKRIRERCDGAKAELRLRGLHPNGNHLLPKGVKYIRERNENGRVVAERWERDPLETERIKRAFQLLFEGYSYRDIARMIGGNWGAKGVRECLENPHVIGVRRYKWEASGPEYLPKPSVQNPEPKKMRRKLKLRSQPTDVPTIEELRSGRKLPIIEPIISLAEWDHAQAVIAERMTRHRKSKIKNDGRPRFLACGIATCSCGEPMYTHYGSRRNPLVDTYFCRTRFRSRGTGCGMTPVRRVDTDAAIEQMIRRLADADFVVQAVNTILATNDRTPDDPARLKREQARTKLENGRREMLAMVRGGDMTRDEFKREMAALEQEVKALEALIPSAAPQMDPKVIAQAIVHVFNRFHRLTFEEKRRLLRGAIKQITIDSHARAITTLTVSGGYLGRGANTVPRSTAPASYRVRWRPVNCSRSSEPDSDPPNPPGCS